MKYEMLPSKVSNVTIASRIAYTAAAIRAWASVNNSGSLFTACQKMGMALFPIILS